MKQTPIRKQIRIQRLQDKNNMAGSAFNPGGHTSESLDARETALKNEWRTWTQKQIEEKRAEIKKMTKHWQGSWPFEWCVFERTYGLNPY